MSNPNTRKSCVVPKCKNTTTNSPEKLFFIVPKDVKMRKKWINAMKRLDPFGDKSTVYCCEDHFDIENDMENYTKYKLVGGRIKLKQGIVPHKFKCQQEKEDKPQRSAVQKRNRLEYFEKLLNKNETSTLEKPEEIFIVSCEDEKFNDMSATSRKGPVFDPGLCRCCGALKKCRLLNYEYDWQGKKEVYSDMFVDSFGLMLSHLDGSELERLICATCVLRLRDASAFRGQVLRCEETLLQASIHVHGDAAPEVKQEEPEVKLEERPEEVEDDDIMDPDYVDQADNDADIDVIEEKPKKLGKKEKKLKSGVKRRREKSRAKRDILQRMKQTTDKLKELENLDVQPPSEKAKRVVDTDYKAYRDCVTLVETSYVCPFDTSFSDYFCVYCRQVFTDPDKLREHTLSHDPAAYKDIVTAVKKLPQIDVHRIDCRLCPVKIDTLDNFKEHINSTHGKNFYPNTSDFLVYRLTLTNLSCLECNSSFGFFHALRKHMAEHFGTCICDVCGAHYFEERMLILHQKSHQRIDENFPCKDCGKNFKSKHSRYLHEARTHKKEPAYQCVKCDAVLFSYTLRYRHMIEVHGEERMFPCEHCDRAYDSRKSLREHNRRSHLKIFKHQCDLCDKRFYLPSRLKEHMATHTGERNYRCEYCGKSYPRLRGLKVHMQSHGAEKKFRCGLCSAAFTQNVNLRNHVKRQHQSLDMDEFHD